MNNWEVILFAAVLVALAIVSAACFCVGLIQVGAILACLCGVGAAVLVLSTGCTP